MRAQSPASSDASEDALVRRPPVQPGGLARQWHTCRNIWLLYNLVIVAVVYKAQSMNWLYLYANEARNLDPWRHLWHTGHSSSSERHPCYFTLHPVWRHTSVNTAKAVFLYRFTLLCYLRQEGPVEAMLPLLAWLFRIIRLPFWLG